MLASSWPASDRRRSPALRYRISSPFRSLVGVSDPQISPDGSRVAFVRTTHDYTHDKNVSRVMIVRTNGGNAMALTTGKNEVSAIRCSPRGDRIAYLSKGAHDSDQIFLVSAAGERSRAVTQAPNDVQQYAWSPAVHGSYMLRATNPLMRARELGMTTSLMCMTTAT